MLERETKCMQAAPVLITVLSTLRFLATGTHSIKLETDQERDVLIPFMVNWG